MARQRARKAPPRPVRKPRFERFPRWVSQVSGVLAVLALLSFHVALVQAIRAGHGGDFYFTAWGLQTTPIGALTSLAFFDAGLIAFAASVAIRRKGTAANRLGSPRSLP